MGIGSIDSAQMALLAISRMNVAGVSVPVGKVVSRKLGPYERASGPGAHDILR